MKLLCFVGLVLVFAILTPTASAYYRRYPSRYRYYYYGGYYYYPRTRYYVSRCYNSNGANIQYTDQTVYGNYKDHCKDPSFSVNYNERYIVYGSVPSVNGSSGLFDENEPLTTYLSETCAFTLTGPTNYYMSIYFSSTYCDKWPEGSSLTVYDGTSSSTSLLSMSTSSCSSQQTYSSGQSVKVVVSSPSLIPDPDFNFTITFTPTTTKQASTSCKGGSYYSSYSANIYGLFVLLVIAIIIIVIIVRCCCYRSPEYGYFHRYRGCCSCCCPNHHMSQTVVYPAEEMVYVTPGGQPMYPQQNGIVVQQNGALVKYERDINGNLVRTEVQEPPPYPASPNNNRSPAPPPYPVDGFGNSPAPGSVAPRSAIPGSAASRRGEPPAITVSEPNNNNPNTLSVTDASNRPRTEVASRALGPPPPTNRPATTMAPSAPPADESLRQSIYGRPVTPDV